MSNELSYSEVVQLAEDNAKAILEKPTPKWTEAMNKRIKEELKFHAKNDYEQMGTC